MMQRNNQLGKLALILASIGWGIGTTTGLVLLFNYQTLPGADGTPVKHLSESRSIAAAENRLLFVMAVHPHCPCTRSSLEALARIMSRSDERAIARVCSIKPKGVSAQWVQTDLWHYASSIPGVEVVCDSEGIQSGQLGLKTSGHVLLFDRDGQRKFSGGITEGRGHHGDNTGLNQCLDFLKGQSSTLNDKRLSSVVH